MSRTTITSTSGTRIAAEDALKMARVDAEKAYRDLSAYRVVITLEADGWHIDYEFKQPGIQGGGPHYVIDAATGTIINKRYEQ